MKEVGVACIVLVMSMNLQRILRGVIILVVVTVLGIAGIYVSAWLWPLLRGQGFAYVAHPFFALVGCGVGAIGAAVASIFYPNHSGWWLAVGLALTWGISALIFVAA